MFTKGFVFLLTTVISHAKLLPLASYFVFDIVSSTYLNDETGSTTSQVVSRSSVGILMSHFHMPSLL